MIFKQFFLNCLAHYSYIIGSNGKACVIDPSRDVDQYLEFLKANNLELMYIIETHSHADFVSGHLELSSITSAPVIYGQKAKVDFTHMGVSDNDTINLGDLDLRFLETPGHTLDSICILATDKNSTASYLFTGDTLFIGDVGRPDLAANSSASVADMASLLYDSLHSKILTLPPEIIIYPGHGAGSLCGKSIGKGHSSTLEEEMNNNALLSLSKEEFIDAVAKNLPPIPAYFKRAVAMNQTGPKSIDSFNNLTVMSGNDINSFDFAHNTLVDVRKPGEFSQGHIKGSINIGLDGQFASWAGSMLDLDKPIYIVASCESDIKEAKIRLARVGIDNVKGYWLFTDSNKHEVKMVRSSEVGVEKLNEILRQDSVDILDIRTNTEFKKHSISGSVNIPLLELKDNLQNLDKFDKIYIICGSGYRSSIAYSYLESLDNFKPKIINIIGGMASYLNLTKSDLTKVKS